MKTSRSSSLVKPLTQVTEAQWATLTRQVGERDAAIGRLIAQGVSLTEVGQRYDLTRERVRQIGQGLVRRLQRQRADLSFLTAGGRLFR